MALGDALAVALMNHRGFKEQDFASFHPGGALGKKLFVKIKDLMRTKNLPLVHTNATLQEAVVAMSQGKLGTVLIVDEDNTFKAILTDGDLRRALMQEDFSMDQLATRYASKNPKSYHNTELLASEALEILENDRIQLLPLVDKKGKVLAVLHIHDLINAGIKSK
jgi:arabinose-5-phosphate isomerase